jgi:hypothetical protein
VVVEAAQLPKPVQQAQVVLVDLVLLLFVILTLMIWQHPPLDRQQ